MDLEVTIKKNRGMRKIYPQNSWQFKKHFINLPLDSD